MIQNWMRYLVPTEWSADQALLAVRLLKQAQHAIWQVHGASMFDAIAREKAYAEHLADAVDLGPAPVEHDEDPGEDPSEDDIPF